MIAFNKRHKKYSDTTRIKAMLLIIILAAFLGFPSIISRSIHSHFSVFPRSSFAQSSISLSRAWQVPPGCLAASWHISGFFVQYRLRWQVLSILLINLIQFDLHPRAPPPLSIHHSLNIVLNKAGNSNLLVS